MAERLARPRLHSSVFAKLMAVMLGMGLALPLMVGGFFILIVRPTLTRSAEGLMVEYMELFAASSPSLETARAAAARHHLQIRCEGPRGGWSTDAGLPAIAEVRLRGKGSGWGPSLAGSGHHVVSRPDGSACLFAWDYTRDLSAAHNRLLVGLLTLLVAVVLLAYVLLRRALGPLRRLQQGVATLSEGNLEVAVPHRTGDEFGVLADAFNQMVVRVREMVQSRDQLLLDVSHELRSPLTRMKVALELCPDDEHRRRLSANVVEMEAMVTELLELERLRQGRGLQIEDCDLIPIVRETVAAFEGWSPGARLVEAPERLVVSIDREKIRTVLGNLLENASKYSLPDSKPISVGLGEGERSVTVRVQDDGPGIPAQDLPNLFLPFFRVDRSRSRKTGGYGLGLSLCKRIMEAHGGAIAVENNGSRGACFVLTLPKRAAARQSS
jgi:signal transduction histidine kinase